MQTLWAKSGITEDRMDLIYYYPSQNRGAPDSVAQNVFKYLYQSRSELRMDLKVFTSGHGIKKIQDEYKDIAIITLQTIGKISRHSLIYIPKSPMISPNDRTILFIYAAIKKIPVISDYHGDFRIELKNSAEDRDFFHFIWNLPSAILAPFLLNQNFWIVVHSPFMAQLLKEKYSIQKNVKIIPNGIDSVDPIKEDTPIKNYPIQKIFFHGRLVRRKGLFILISAFNDLVKENNNIFLYIAGDGPIKEELIRRCEEYKITDNVIFLGRPIFSEIIDYLKSVDLSIYPSLYDNFPLAILEALAFSNCPVCISKKGGIYDFVQNNDKLISFNPTVEDTHLIMKALLFDFSDKSLIQRQKEFSQQFVWKNVIKQYICFFNELQMKF